MSGPPQCDYPIRHAEKPTAAGIADANPEDPAGVDTDGAVDPHSLTPRGWQRSGAPAVLLTRPPRPGEAPLTTPDQLLAPSYGTVARTTEHRTFQTLLGLSEAIGSPIASLFPFGAEAQLADAVLTGPASAGLICWEHPKIHDIVDALPVEAATPAPTAWPGGRFDLIWQLRRTADAPVTYEFNPLPPDVLGGDGSSP